jgi:hypothetical protein
MKLIFFEASSLLKTKIALRVTFHNNITSRLLKIRGGASPPSWEGQIEKKKFWRG